MACKDKVKVLFVCLGNICRSPTAEGVFGHLVRERGLEGRVEVDSAGTSAWHVGEAPDRRSQAEARRHGVEIGGQRSRAVAPEDFEAFDYVVAMDGENLRALQSRCPKKFLGRVHQCTLFAPDLNVADVPDPYYGGPNGFEHVYRIIEAGASGLLDRIQQQDLK